MSFYEDTICNITQEPQDLQKLNVPVGSPASLLLKNIINSFQSFQVLTENQLKIALSPTPTLNIQYSYVM